VPGRFLERAIPSTLAGFGAYLLAISAWMLVAPGSFFEALGPFGVRNDHYIRDAATFQFALGLLALAAVWRPQLRLAALGVIGAQFLLHAINHLADIREADPEWVGVADFIGLSLAGAALAGVFVAERRRAR
jgi:uncharacterized membrane protein (UPF0182 family)